MAPPSKVKPSAAPANTTSGIDLGSRAGTTFRPGSDYRNPGRSAPGGPMSPPNHSESTSARATTPTRQPMCRRKSPERYSKARSLCAIRSRDQPTLTRQDRTARRNRSGHVICAAIGATVGMEVPDWARSARPPVMKAARRPASLGVRCDVATQLFPRHKLITTYPESLCQVARNAERSPSVMNSRR